jgi:hypothetical protein
MLGHLLPLDEYEEAPQWIKLPRPVTVFGTMDPVTLDVRRGEGSQFPLSAVPPCQVKEGWPGMGALLLA